MNGQVVASPFRLVNGYGDPIHGEVRYLSDGVRLPVVVICHSFMAFKDWGFFPYVADHMARAGIAAVTFNFSLNGVEGNGTRITQFSKFESNTVSRELHDLATVVDAVGAHGMNVDNIDRAAVGLAGHSRGGGIAILHAAADTRVRALATWSSISTFDRWTNHQRSQWRRLGFLPLAKDSAVSPLRLGIGLLNDIESRPQELSVVSAAKRLKIPWLIVHGKADVLVGVAEAERLYEASDKSTTTLFLLDHVGHLYNAATEGGDQYQTVHGILELTTSWLHRHFS